MHVSRTLIPFRGEGKRRIFKESDNFEFVIPKEGGVIEFENIVIPVFSEKQEMAHQFIDFLLSQDVVKYHVNLFEYNPVNKNSYSLIEKRLRDRMFEQYKYFRKDRILKGDLPLKKLENLWIAVKSA